MTKVIKLKDGLEVEVDVLQNQAQEISSNNTADSSIDKIQDMLTKVMTPIIISA